MPKPLRARLTAVAALAVAAGAVSGMAAPGAASDVDRHRQDATQEFRPDDSRGSASPSGPGSLPDVALGDAPSEQLAALLASPNRTVGRLYHSSLNEKCTAAVVSSEHHVLVLTAGHCLAPGDGSGYYTDFVFIPGYRGGDPTPIPYGSYQGKKPSVMKGWGMDGDHRYDVGFLTLEPNAAGQPVGEVVGENEISVNAGYEGHRTVFGYLGNNTQAICFAPIRPLAAPPESRVRIDCPGYEKGASGGPWFESYDAASQLGVINGVNSTTNDARTAIASPYFDSALEDLYQLNYPRS